MNDYLSDEEEAQPVKEPVKPIKEPGEVMVRLTGWLIYTLVMAIFLGPFAIYLSYLQYFGLALLLGHFSAQLNAIKNKL